MVLMVAMVAVMLTLCNTNGMRPYNNWYYPQRHAHRYVGRIDDNDDDINDKTNETLERRVDDNIAVAGLNQHRQQATAGKLRRDTTECAQ